MTRTALMQNSLRAAAALAPLLFLAPGHAQSEIPGFIAPTATATYTISPEGLKPGAVVLVALQIKTTPGWHVYWVNPGDSGLPTHITWTTPKNVTALFTRFPTPIRFQSEGSTSYGFQDGMTALTQMRVSGPRQPLASDLKAHVDLLLCANACVPEHIEASPTGLTGAEALSVINVAETTMPAHAGIAGTIEIDHGRAEIGFERTDGKSFGPIQGAYFYPSKPNILNANAPQHVWVGNTGFVISTEASTDDTRLSGTEGILVFPDGKAYEVSATPGRLAQGTRSSWANVLLIYLLSVLALVAGLSLINQVITRRGRRLTPKEVAAS